MSKENKGEKKLSKEKIAKLKKKFRETKRQFNERMKEHPEEKPY